MTFKVIEDPARSFPYSVATEDGPYGFRQKHHAQYFARLLNAGHSIELALQAVRYDMEVVGHGDIVGYRAAWDEPVVPAEIIGFDGPRVWLTIGGQSSIPVNCPGGIATGDRIVTAKPYRFGGRTHHRPVIISFPGASHG